MPEEPCERFRDLCRSALAIAKRSGEKTNWVAFTAQLERAFADFPATGSTSEQGDDLIDETQRRMDQVVEAAVEWHQSDEDWFEKSEVLANAIDSLLELRSKSCAQREIGAGDEMASVGSHQSDILGRSESLLPPAGERDENVYCWHCGDALSEWPKPHCERCPTECDVEGCDELGCAPATTAESEERPRKVFDAGFADVFSPPVPDGAAEKCSHCGEWIDPRTCWCGESKDKHGDYDNHGFVPMGCNCYRNEGDSKP